MEAGRKVRAAGTAGLEVVFPDAGDAPAAGVEVGADAAVAGAVAAEFLVPEGAVAGGAGLVLGAAVPEAAVEEDGEFLLGEVVGGYTHLVPNVKRVGLGAMVG